MMRPLIRRLAAAGVIGLLAIPSAVQPAGPPSSGAIARVTPAAPVKTPPAAAVPAPPAKVEIKPTPPKPETPAPVVPLVIPCPPPDTLRYTLLRSAQLGAAYKNTLATGGGRAPYSFSPLKCGALPDGIQVEAAGAVQGTPTAAGIFRFSVSIQDSSMPPAIVVQHYELRVFTQATAKPKAPVTPGADSKKPAAVDLHAVSGDEAKRSLQDAKVQKSVSYMLTEKIIEKLLEPPKPAKPAKDDGDDGDASSASGKEKAAKADAELKKDPHLDQRKEVLMKMKDTEYPSRDLFAKALDANVCVYVNTVAATIAAAKSTPTVKVDAEKMECSTWDTKPVGTTLVTAAKPFSGEGEIRLADWPKLILPDRERDRVIESARVDHYFDDVATTTTIRWTGKDCGCTKDMGGNQVYGFYPFWMADPPGQAAKPLADKDGKDAEKAPPPAGDPQVLDFSLLTRIGYAALPFNDDGSLAAIMHWKESNADFVREAQTHRTGLDLVLYRNDWSTLLNDDNKIKQVIAKLPDNVLREIDAPLTDWRSQLKSWASFLEPAPTMGTGITLYFDGVEEKDQVRFAAFFNGLVTALVDNMHRRSRHYALNVVIPSGLLNKKNSAYEFRTLVDHLTHAEKLEVKNDRIITNLESAASNSNVDLNFLILLPEPTTDSKKELRLLTEWPDVPSLKGSSRKFFLRNLVPVISYNGANDQQFEDDLVYFSDNFGGVSFWTVPLNNPDPQPGAKIYRDVAATFVVAESSSLDKVGQWICPHRWWLRVLMIVLLLVDAIAISLRFLMCSGPVQTQQYTMFLWALAVLNMLLWMIALGTDPALSDLVKLLLSPKFMGAVSAVLMVWIYIQAHQKRYRKP